MAIAVDCPSCGCEFRAKEKNRGKSTACIRCGKSVVIEGNIIPDFDVFVSYSSKDRQICDAVIATLEAAKIRCWVAPRDIVAGADWGASIIEGIASSRIMVLLFTGNSNVSPQVLREVERAVNRGLSVVPMRIDMTPLSPNMEYFISSSHWLDAMTPPLESHLSHLVRSVRSLMDEDEAVDCRRGIQPQPRTASKDDGWLSAGDITIASASRADSPEDGNSVLGGNREGRHSLRNVALILIVPAIAIVLAAAYGPWRMRREGRPPTDPRGIASPQSAHPSILKSNPSIATASAPHGQVSATLETAHGGIITNFLGMKFVPIPAGEFMMGSPENEAERKPNETLHKVKITHPFYMGMYHVTRRQFTAFVDAEHYQTQAEKEPGADTWRNPNCEQTDEHPVVCVSWNDAVKFIEWLNIRERDQGHHYRLPTEAEWEYACRAGTSTRFYTGDSEEALGLAGWYYPKDDGGTRPVGGKAPNKWGLFDMHGNARQWCSDRFGAYVGDAVDPQGPPNRENKGSRIMRGGSWKDEPRGCRAACRETGAPELRFNCFGFRVCLDFPSQATPAPSTLPSTSFTTAPPMDLRLVTNTLGMKFVPIPAGDFMMGSPETEVGRMKDRESPFHKVTITKPFYMGVHHVTRGQFGSFVKELDYKTDAEKKNDRWTWQVLPFTQTADHPAVHISWDDAMAFIAWLNAKEKNEGRTYRLPTEAEWEYACRAGTTTRFYTGDDEQSLAQAAWSSATSDGHTHPVGMLAPNKWGLYDMHGHAWQWCSDAYGPYTGDVVDPKREHAVGSRDGLSSSYVMRGGALNCAPNETRSAMRSWNGPDIAFNDQGFRLCFDRSSPSTITTPPPALSSTQPSVK